jgi:hypothetical protein
MKLSMDELRAAIEARRHEDPMQIFDSHGIDSQDLKVIFEEALAEKPPGQKDVVVMAMGFTMGLAVADAVK